MRRARRLVARVAAGYAIAVVAFHLFTFGLVLVTRLLGHDPRSDELATVHNLRQVDEQVFAGAQPHPDQYDELARGGVHLVIDLRTGARDDPREDDPARLAAMGIDYLHLPVKDGHVPSPETVRRLVDAIDGADGLVYVHCGGGVGRSAAAQAAYVDARGDEPSWMALASLGPMSLEQLWFVADHRTNPVVRRVSEALDAPRRLWSRIGGWW
ncbi:MAG: fused DSP-PTPase phosphatase/NAD kinase-like protein [Acidimicrobiales bacterium]